VDIRGLRVDKRFYEKKFEKIQLFNFKNILKFIFLKLDVGIKNQNYFYKTDHFQSNKQVRESTLGGALTWSPILGTVALCLHSS